MESARDKPQRQDCKIKRVSGKIKRGNGLLRGQVARNRKGPLWRVSVAFPNDKGGTSRPRPRPDCRDGQAARTLGLAFHAFRAVIALRAPSIVRKRMLSTLKHLRSQPIRCSSSQVRA